MDMRTSLSTSPWMMFFFAKVFPWPFVIGGVVMLFLGGRGLLRAWDSVAWPTAPGVVRNSTVECQSGGNHGATYHAQIRYEYVVNDTTFSGSRVAYGDYGSSNPAHAQGIVNRYPVGAAVVVHHMRAEPEECLLEPGVQTQAWFVPGIGLLFFSMGSLMVVFLPRLLAKQALMQQHQADAG